MIGALATLILLCTLYLILAAEDPQQITVTVVDLGGNVNLKCPSSEKDGKFFQWYKLPLGYIVQTVATGTYYKQTLETQFNNSRFKVTEGETHYSLTIRNVRKEDEATYLCESGAAYSKAFVYATFLAVNDPKHQKSVNVKQSPETASVQRGKSVTLQCSLLSKNKENRVQCPGEHSVYWFRAGSGGSPPAIVHTHRNSSDKQDERSCVYSLSKTIRNSSDTGTYYCAVVTCGEILFGEGTQVGTRSELDSVILVLGGLLACCVIVITILIFFLNRRRVCEHCKGEKGASHLPGHDKPTVAPSTDQAGDAEAENYAALNFSATKVKRVKKKTESPQECVYSAVRVGYHTQHQPSL